MGSARWWPPLARGSGQWRHSLSGEGLGEPDGVAGGLADVGVMQEPKATVAVARVLGMSSSKAAGCRFELTATERFS